MSTSPIYLFIAQAAAKGLPLASMDVDVDIRGPYADITVRQTFDNTHEDFIEAVYTFPLHEDGAVDAVAMRIGEREIRAEIHERDEAKRIYDQAKDQGQAAALTEQERPNIFTQSVANIPPGQQIEVVLHLTQPITYEDGTYTFAYPLTVGPRFSPAGVADVAAITPPTVSGPTGAVVNLDVSVDFGMALAEVESPSHPTALEATQAPQGRFVAVLEGARPDRDVVLRFRPEAGDPQVSFLSEGEHFSLMFEPDAAPEPAEVVPRELIFVVDNSCSMSGTPMSMAKSAMHEALDQLLPKDSFQVIRFSEAASQLSGTPLMATPENVELGHAFVDAMQGMGGTHMLAGVEAALDYPRTDRKRIVCFMTDGYIGNERQILAAIDDKIGDSRLFGFGIGSSVNRYLLSRMADVGRGDVTFVLLNESPEGKVEAFYERIARPVLTDIEIDWGGLGVSEVYPQRIPDLFVGQPLRVVGKFNGQPGTATIRGRLGDGAFEETVEVEPTPDGTAIGSAWARRRVQALEAQLHWGEVEEVRDTIIKTALDYQLLTQYTSFVAVEHRVANHGDAPLRIHQPSELPTGVTFTELSRKAMRPGDPLLTVDAPADARRVWAVFPWGEVDQLRWDRVRERWYHRFLVPRDVPEQLMRIQVFVELADGSVELQIESLRIDATAPELEARITWEDGETVLRMPVLEPLRDVQMFLPGQPERRIRALVAPDASEVELRISGEHPAVVLVVKDVALNRIQQVVTR